MWDTPGRLLRLPEVRDAGTCVLHAGARTVADLAHFLQEAGLEITVESPDALREHLRATAARLARAAGSPDPAAM